MHQTHIRNFSIIAHIDHGKTTLTDQLLRLTKTVAVRDLTERMLDSNPIEKERGVTIKLAPVTMNYQLQATTYQLNLIDTPGHVDFSYEVERSLAACESALLLIDASQGVQAQTIAHTYKALDLGLDVIPALNKVDLDSAEIEKSLSELKQVFGFRPEEISQISAKTGTGIIKLLDRLITSTSAPSGAPDKPLRALVFNSTYDPHLGVIAFIRVVDGQLSTHQHLHLLQAQKHLEVKELGIFTPGRLPVGSLTTGAVGYIATGLKNIRDLKVGDTVVFEADLPLSLTPLPGYQPPQPTVYADFYPAEDSNFHELSAAIDKLQLTDAALISHPVHSPVLGSGFRLGFLGAFHVTITKERLFREQGVSTIITNPTVEYQITTTTGETILVHNPNDLPDLSQISLIKEPIAKVTVIGPVEFLGALMELLQSHRGIYHTTHHLGHRVQLEYLLPLAELISGFFDKLKSVSQGFATLDYHLVDPAPVDAVKLTIFLNHQEIAPLSRIVVASKAQSLGKKLVTEIKDILPKHVFAVPIQAAIGGTIIARETKPATRKDVTAKLYGGDQTRKDKLLKKQKKGKKRLAKFGRVNIPDDVLTKLATVG